MIDHRRSGVEDRGIVRRWWLFLLAFIATLDVFHYLLSAALFMANGKPCTPGTDDLYDLYDLHDLYGLYDLYDLFPLQFMIKVLQGRWIPALYVLALVAWWEPYNLHDLGCFTGWICIVCVSFTLNRSLYPSTSSTPSVRADSSS